MITGFVRVRIELQLKTKAEAILHELGITPTKAITMLYKRIAKDHEWPLELKIPNQETLKVFEETDRGIGLFKSSKNGNEYIPVPIGEDRRS